MVGPSILFALGLSIVASSAATAQPAFRTASPSHDFAARALAAHNRERLAVGVEPLQWSDTLARSARLYGPRLAAIGTLTHSPRASRPGEAENLWKGTRGAYPVEGMVGYWADERRMFRAGLFPNVSMTGNWLDVSHYTQMIWPETTHVGCHVEQSRTHDFLICRYSPKGNRDGRWVGRALSSYGARRP